MRGTFVILRRELGALFFAPLAWILLFAALLLNGYGFASMLGYLKGDVTASLEHAFGGGFFFWALTIVLAPLLTMRLVTEESANGTLEYLRTAPVSDAAVVLGKFLAGAAFMALLWSSVLVYAGTVHLQGLVPDWGQVFAIYIGTVLVSSLFIALSMTTSTLTNSPLLGAFLSFIVSLFWLLMPVLGLQLLGQVGPLAARVFGSRELADDVVVGILDRMAVAEHFQRSYHQGVVDSAELVFFVTWIAFFLFLTTRLLEGRRWRG